MREAVVEAFERLGGVDYLVELGRSDPSTFVRLLARMVPNETAAKTEEVVVYHRIHVRAKPETATDETSAVVPPPPGEC